MRTALAPHILPINTSPRLLRVLSKRHRSAWHFLSGREGSESGSAYTWESPELRDVSFLGEFSDKVQHHHSRVALRFLACHLASLWSAQCAFSSPWRPLQSSAPPCPAPPYLLLLHLPLGPLPLPLSTVPSPCLLLNSLLTSPPLPAGSSFLCPFLPPAPTSSSSSPHACLDLCMPPSLCPVSGAEPRPPESCLVESITGLNPHDFPGKRAQVQSQVPGGVA